MKKVKGLSKQKLLDNSVVTARGEGEWREGEEGTEGKQVQEGDLTWDG